MIVFLRLRDALLPGVVLLQPVDPQLLLGQGGFHHVDVGLRRVWRVAQDFIEVPQYNSLQILEILRDLDWHQRNVLPKWVF